MKQLFSRIYYFIFLSSILFNYNLTHAGKNKNKTICENTPELNKSRLAQLNGDMSSELLDAIKSHNIERAKEILIKIQAAEYIPLNKETYTQANILSHQLGLNDLYQILEEFTDRKTHRRLYLDDK